MKRIWITTVTLCVALAVTITAQQRSTQMQAEAALGAAIHQEEAEGNLEGAIANYKKFLSQYGNIRPLAAKAQYHLGLAYEKLGDAEARKAYERVTREFSDQKEVAADANKRLAALNVPRAVGGSVPRLISSEKYLEVGSISSDGRQMALVTWATAEDDGSIVLREIVTGQSRVIEKGTCGPGASRCTFANSPVFSPDSRQLAYAWYDQSEFGGAATLRVKSTEAGAKPRLLVGSSELNIWPRGWSPDGKRLLAIVRKSIDRTWQIVWVSAADGSMQVLKSLDWRFASDTRLGKDPSLSPDGRYIAYAALPANPKQPQPTRLEASEQHIYVLASDGSNEAELVKGAALNTSPLWTADSSKIVFLSNLSGTFDLWSVPVRAANAAGAPSLVQRDVGQISPAGVTRTGSYYYVSAREGVEEVSIAELGANGQMRAGDSFVGVNPTWSPDGKLLAFSRHRTGDAWDLVVRSVATGDERVYVHDGLRPFQPRWFADSKRVIQDVVLSGKPRTPTSLDLARNEFAAMFVGESYDSPIVALSPDNQTVYIASRDPKARTNAADRITALDLSGASQKQAVIVAETPTAFGFALSPDGSQFAILAIENRNIGHLMVAGVDGAGRRELLSDFRVVNPFGKIAWSKDGRSILFATYDGYLNGNYQIMRIAADGGKPEFTGLTVKALSTFDVGPDGSRIAFSTLASGTSHSEFFSIDDLGSLAKESK